MDKPRTPEQYRLSLFGPSDLPRFQPYIAQVTRHAHLLNQAAKFPLRLETLKRQSEAAIQKFQSTLADSDYEAMISAVATHRREADAITYPQFGHVLQTAFAPAVFAKEFPRASKDLVPVMRFYVEKLMTEAKRVRPGEMRRLEAEDAALAYYGTPKESAPLEQRSPVLRDLMAAVESANNLIARLESGSADFQAVGSFVHPIVAAISTQKLS